MVRTLVKTVSTVSYFFLLPEGLYDIMLAFASFCGFAMSTAFIRDLRGRKSPSNTKNIKIGVLGCGSMGSAAVRRLASFPTSFVVNAWNRTFEKAENLGANAYRSAEGMIAKSDVVVIFLGSFGSCFPRIGLWDLKIQIPDVKICLGTNLSANPTKI